MTRLYCSNIDLAIAADIWPVLRTANRFTLFLDSPLRLFVTEYYEFCHQVQQAVYPLLGHAIAPF